MYAYTSKSDVAVEVSTCGSLFDTRLYVFDDPADTQVCGVVNRAAVHWRVPTSSLRQDRADFPAAVATNGRSQGVRALFGTAHHLHGLGTCAPTANP